MFKVKWRESWEDVTVYDVRYDSNGFPQFLIYSKDTREWLLVSAKHFLP